MAGICASRSVGLAAQSPIVTSAASPEAFISEVVHQPPDWQAPYPAFQGAWAVRASWRIRSS
ncbi:hypothetical protein ACIRBY_32110 [Streptomyces sp. NPDC096136]|uniref:hypothetical protein n=1 Tax=Streptomyces sp. NPDC096136 TaxID=3366076 RepID=UPI0037FC5E13